MKIKEAPLAADQKVINVTKAHYLGNYVIGIEFNDGTYREVNFKPFLCKAQHPDIRKYLDEKRFAKFEVVDGNLNWNDYEMIFPVWDLYQGKIEA